VLRIDRSTKRMKWPVLRVAMRACRPSQVQPDAVFQPVARAHWRDAALPVRPVAQRVQSAFSAAVRFPGSAAMAVCSAEAADAAD
jgi:hypothetical protein